MSEDNVDQVGREAVETNVETVAVKQNETTADSGSTQHEEEDVLNVMGILAYLGILVLIPLLVEKDDAFVRYHTKQGLVLAAGSLAWFVITMVPIFGWMLFIFTPFVMLAIIIMSIIGIVHVVKKEMKPLPLIGGLANKFKI